MPETESITMHYDRSINRLPEDLLLTIVERLSVDDAVRTGFLSHKWRDLWKHISIINFGPDWVESTGKDITPSINKFISLHQGKTIEKFSVEVTYTPEMSSSVDSWILFALRKHVLDLNLEFNVKDGDPCYQLLPSVFSSESLTSLTLAYCDLKLPESIQLQSLEEVHFSQIELPDNAIHTLTSNAPVLQYLLLTDCNRTRDFCISVPSDRHLHLLMLSDSKSVFRKRKKMVLQIPSVKNLVFFGCLLRSEYHLQDIAGCCSVQFLFDEMFSAFQENEMDIMVQNYMVLGWYDLLQHFLLICRLANSVLLSNWYIQVLTLREQRNLREPTLHCTSLEMVTAFNKWTLPGIVHMLKACPNVTVVTIQSSTREESKHIPVDFGFQADIYLQGQRDSGRCNLQNLENVEFIIRDGDYQTWEEGCFDPHIFFKGSYIALELITFLTLTARNLKSMTFKTSEQCHEVHFPRE